MLEDIFFFTIYLFLGVFAGVISGILPGVHINLIASILPSLLPLFSLEPISLVIFITSMAITHTFVDFIPSIFLGAPNSETALSAMPGHKFLLKGYGHYALKLTITGCLIGIFSLIIIIPLLFLVLEKVYPFFNKMMAFFLIWIVIFLVVGEKGYRLDSLIIFILSGIYGLSVFGISIKNPLLPMLTGLFGIPIILESIKNKTKIPPQESENQLILKGDLVKPSIVTLFISPVFSIFPGLGSSEAAVIGSRIGKRMNSEQFLILLGSINTLVISTSFVTLFLIDKARSGAAASISSIINLDIYNLKTILLTIFFASIISATLTFKISKLISNSINKINYSKISLVVFLFVIFLNLLVSGFNGLFTLIVGSVIGFVCIKLNVRKSFLMGCLLLPTIIYYLPL